MRNTAIQPAVLNAMIVVNLLNGALMQTVMNQPMSLCLFLQGIVSTVRQFWKLGAAVRELGGCGLGAVLSSLVNRNYHVKHAKVAGTAVTTLLACLQSPASMHKSDYICFQQPQSNLNPATLNPIFVFSNLRLMSRFK